MIHDIIFALNGWPGDIFTEKLLPNGQVLISFNSSECSRISSGNLELGCGDMLLKSDLCQISAAVSTIRRFILNQHQRCSSMDDGSIYNNQLAFAFHTFLRDVYEPILIRVEKDYLAFPENVITPLSLLAEVGKFKDALNSFVFILNRVADGVPVLNATWQAFSRLNSGVQSPSLKALESVLLVLVIPFLNQLEEWLNKGSVSADRDPFNEFFIEGSGELRSERLPPFVDISIANKAIMVGDLRRELQSKGHPSFSLAKSIPCNANLGDELPRIIATAVVKAHRRADFEMALQLVSAGALKLISQCCELSFMNRGELFSTWLLSSSVNHILRFNHKVEPHQSLNIEKFASVLGSELRIAAQRLYTTVKHESLNVSLDNARFELEDLGLKTLPRFKVFLFPVSTIPPALTRVFPSETVHQYRSVFNYLVMLRLAASALNSTWLSLVTTRRGIKGRHQQVWVNETREKFALLARMSRALAALEQHAFHVIRLEKEEFLAVARRFDNPNIEESEMQDCDTFVMAHAKMISKISYELVRPSQNYQLRTSLVSCILQATELNEKMPLLQASQQQFHLNPTDFDKFAPLLSLLLRQQTMILGSLSILPLHSLLLSMDFNEFYSQQQ